MKRKFWVRNFRKLGYTSRTSCPLFFSEIQENAIPFAAGNFWIFKQDFMENAPFDPTYRNPLLLPAMNN